MLSDITNEQIPDTHIDGGVPGGWALVSKLLNTPATTYRCFRTSLQCLFNVVCISLQLFVNDKESMRV